MRNSILFVILFAFVLLINAPLLSFDLMYAEQPMLFAANQSIQSLSDLFNIYLHPKMLDIFSVPFFRPSGHFLMYQLITPFLGWHNTRAFVAINLFFLALTGYVLLKLYELLFPGFKMGAYLALGIYLMHPALMLSRLIVLHFEFAYVFFTLLSVYCLVFFCLNTDITQKKIQKYSFLLGALGFYAVAVTFKEPAMMLGPVLVCCLGIFLYRGQALPQYFYDLTHNKQILQIVTLIITTGLSLALYLSLAWPTLRHPLGTMITSQEKMAAARELINTIVGFSSRSEVRAALHQPNLIWRELIFTPLTKAILWILWFMTLLSTVKMGLSSLRAYLPRFISMAMPEEPLLYKKSWLFLWVAAMLFMVLPVNWAMGLPWHLNLTLIFLSLIAGFACEDLSQYWGNHKKSIYLVGLIFSILIGLNTIAVNNANLQHLVSRNGFSLAVGRNAVFHPPAIKNKLNADTIVLVADSILRDSYALGNSHYPLFLGDELDFDALQKMQAFSFLRYQAIYNGYLFKWAYLMPELQEEVYPFDVNKLGPVPDAVIHNWLQHYSNIVCLGYDRQANWHDQTAEFKKNLLLEQAKRLLVVHQYELRAAAAINGNVLYTRKLGLPDYQICQYECDQNVQCKGFTYEKAQYQYHSVMKCQFYDSLSQEKEKFCATCIGFIKGALL